MKTVLAGPTGNHRGPRLMSMTSTRADDMTIVFFFFIFTSLLEKPWEPCSQTACCLISCSCRCYSCPYKLAPVPLMQPVLTFPLVIILSSRSFSFFFSFTHLRPCFTLTGYTSSASLSSIQGPGTWWNKKKKTLHLPAGHIFKDSAECGLSGCAAFSPCSPLFCELAPECLQPGCVPQAQAAFLICFFHFLFNDHVAVSNQAGRAVTDKSKSF